MPKETKTEKLKRLIREKFGSQLAFAANVNEQDSFVSQVVNNWKTVPTWRQEHWAGALGCKVGDIF